MNWFIIHKGEYVILNRSQCLKIMRMMPTILYNFYIISNKKYIINFTMERRILIFSTISCEKCY